jgi:hypothetical protein
LPPSWPFALTIRARLADERSLLDLIAANRLTALRGYGFSAEGFRALLDLLPAAKALTDLDLAGTEFEPAGTALLCRTLPATRLRTFGFTGGWLLKLKKSDLRRLRAARRRRHRTPSSQRAVGRAPRDAGHANAGTAPPSPANQRRL